MSQSQSSRRAALRAQQQAQETASRRRKIISVIAGVVAVAVIAVVVIIAITRNSGDGSSASNQVTPPSADASTGIYTLNADKVRAGAPTVTVYEDYQCPICKEAETAFGPSLDALSAKGQIKLQWRTLTFLDDNLRNDASYRAAMAAAAADKVGKLEAYHNVIYKNQPTQEGQGYTDEQLRVDFAKDAGITGNDLVTFQKLYDSKATSSFVKNAASKGLEEGTKLDPQFGTPFFTVNGKAWTGWRQVTNPTESTVLAAIQAAAK
ncbi:DsbA family protein [Acidipropionibacterium timonense]|uniref:DsbA family protein n=1 Tax=Acidipropionibacterium timonense TaxID=2161818 RepID=UPI001031D4A4|nr:thioredoxin domain-containing protein [Acidipropionibacterium timonense]